MDKKSALKAIAVFMAVVLLLAMGIVYSFDAEGDGYNLIVSTIGVIGGNATDGSYSAKFTSETFIQNATITSGYNISLGYIHMLDKTTDATPPIVNTSLNKSLTNIGFGDVINFSANVTDETGLSFCQIIINQSGPDNLEIINVSLSGKEGQCYNVSEVALFGGSVINYTIRVNDTSNNFRTNDTIITVVDDIAPVVNTSFNKSLTNIGFGDVINFSANVTDESSNGLSFCQIIINQSGPNNIHYENISLNGATSAQCHNVTNITLLVGDVINFTIRVNDTFNNIRTNDTIITVVEFELPNVTSIKPPDEIANYTSNSIRFYYNVSDFSPIGNCSLEINGTVNATVDSPAKETTNFIVGNLSNGAYSWSVSCIDTFNNRNSSVNRTIHVRFLNETKGIIPTTKGAVPFFTDQENPDNSCTNLVDGDVCTITWSVNATGNIGERYVFFAFGNATNYTIIYNETIRINVTIIGITPFVDTTAPIVNTSFNKSLSNILQNDVINFSANITDETGLSFCQIIINQSGPDNLEIINVSLSGTSGQCYNVTAITLAAGRVINFTIRANDTSNNFRTNDTIITVASAAANIPIIKLNNASTSNPAFAVDPVDGSFVEVLISFNVTDADGVATINASKAVVNFTLGYNDGQWRSNVSDQGSEFGTCSNHTQTGPGAEADRVIINCTITMRYYDNQSSNWFINVSVKDTDGNVGRNDTVRFTYNELSAMSFATAYINFSTITVGVNDQAAANPLILNNTGNDDFDQINITASALVGQTTPSETVAVSLFAVNTTNAAAGKGLPLTTSPQAIRGVDDTANQTLVHGHTSALTYYNDIVISAKGNQSLYFWVDDPGAVSSQKYNATWNISVIDLP